MQHSCNVLHRRARNGGPLEVVSETSAMITVELFGVPRLRAGIGQVALEASTVSAAVEHLGKVCPALEGSVIQEGRVHPAYRLSLNGDRFVSDPETPLSDGDVLLLLAADVGG